MLNRLLRICVVICMAGLTASLYAQGDETDPVYGQPALDQLLAPVALYPDPLLSQILMAATYPLEVVQAERWLQQHPGLHGAALADAARDQQWEPSVKALLEFPSVLAMMDRQLPWTEKLGDAFLARQDAVMDTVQALRARAQAAGTLHTTPQQQVSAEQGDIVITPTAPDVVYVPYYDPTVVYGAWWWPERPPMVWLPGEYMAPYGGVTIAGGIAFGLGVALVDTLFIEAWPDWRGHRVNLIHGPGGPRGPATVWSHDPAHRHGVAYRDPEVGARFHPNAPVSQPGAGYRGHAEAPGRSERPFSSQSPVARPHDGALHPFMPSGPPHLIQSHVERGRDSRGAGATPQRPPSRHSR